MGHAITKRCFAPFKSDCPFLLYCPKEMDERKGHRCAGLVGRIPRTGFAGCCGRPLRGAFFKLPVWGLKRLDGGSPTALVSDCVGRFRVNSIICFLLKQ